MILTIVVDDEKPSREVLSNYLRDYCEDIQVVAKASSVKSAYKAIRKHNPDLLFLDIELGDGKGFDLLSKFDKIDFRIIFVTAYSEFAIKAFRVNAVDYLLKPVKIDELKAAVEKAKSLDSKINESERIAELLKNFLPDSSKQPTITIPHIKGFDVLKVNEMIMCKADGYCTNFFLTGKRKIVSSKNLKYYERLLGKHNFVRVHYSYLINLNHICRYTKQGEIELSEGNRAPLSDSNKKMFFEILSR